MTTTFSFDKWGECKTVTASGKAALISMSHNAANFREYYRMSVEGKTICTRAKLEKIAALLATN